MENQTTLMQELYLVLKESLRKQAFSVVLLICACAGLWALRQADRVQLLSEITILSDKYDSCSSARETQATEIRVLSVQVATLQERINLMADVRFRK